MAADEAQRQQRSNASYDRLAADVALLEPWEELDITFYRRQWAAGRDFERRAAAAAAAGEEEEV